MVTLVPSGLLCNSLAPLNPVSHFPNLALNSGAGNVPKISQTCPCDLGHVPRTIPKSPSGDDCVMIGS